MPLYKAVTSTNAMSSRTAKISEPVSAFESRNSAKLRDIKNNAMELGARNKNRIYDLGINQDFDLFCFPTINIT